VLSWRAVAVDRMVRVRTIRERCRGVVKMMLKAIIPSIIAGGIGSGFGFISNKIEFMTYKLYFGMASLRGNG